VRTPLSSHTTDVRPLWSILFVLPHLVGCLSAPKPASQVVAEVPRPKKGETPKADVDAAVLPAGYWSKSGDVNPASALERGRRVVITGFEVELVDLQFQPPIPRQPAFKPLPIPLSGFGLTMIPGVVFEVVGFGRRSTPMPEAEQRALTSQLYDAFEADLRGRGLVVVPREDVIASRGNAERSKRPVEKSSPLMLLNPLGSDTGQVLHSRTVTEPGLGRGRGKFWDDRSEAGVRIMKDTNADVALDVRLRVGTYRKKAAMEHRSEIRLTTSEGHATLKARHSILSDDDVTGGTHFVPVVGRVVPVNPGEFTRELKAILPKFVSLALASGKS
jgi:hypothetical protein